MLKLFNHNIILPKYLEIVKKLGSSLSLPAPGWAGARATIAQNPNFENWRSKRDERPSDAKSDELPLTGFALRGFESNCFTLFSYIAYIAF